MDLERIETPAVLIDLAIVRRNIARGQEHVGALGMAMRPHIKTHKLPLIGRMQIDAGAAGIACQKLSEAEVFAAEGFADILLCYNILGAAKLERLQRLARAVNLRVVADSERVVDALAEAGSDLGVLVECDTGLRRCGVQSPSAARDLALRIAGTPGLRFGGLMTYPAPDNPARVQAFLAEAVELCEAALGPVPCVSTGGTPAMATAGQVPAATEYRPGTYVYNDRSLVARGACTVGDCALTVLSRVISRPTRDRAVLDAGSKTLSSDLLGLTGYGMLPDFPDARIVALSEEHGHVEFSQPAKLPAVGDLVRIIPNHACPVSNLTDVVHLHEGDSYLGPQPVAARGCVT